MSIIRFGVKLVMKLVGMHKKMEDLRADVGARGPYPTFSHPLNIDTRIIEAVGDEKTQSLSRGFKTEEGKTGVSWAEVRPGDVVCNWMGTRRKDLFAIRDGGDGYWRFVGGVMMPNMLFAWNVIDFRDDNLTKGMESFSMR
jgi:hypothetical protein